MASGAIKPRVTPDINSMALILHIRGATTNYPLTQVRNILKDKDFDINKNLAIFITGWMSDPNDDYVGEMADAFNCRGDYNFMVCILKV